MNLEKLKKITPGKTHLIQSEKTPIPELNFQIVKYLINEKKTRVLFISIEKPHQYMTYILGMHHVSQRNITYIDVMNSKGMKFPITLQEMKNLHVGGFILREIIVLKDYDYVIVDNIEHLQHIWIDETFREFIKSLVDNSRKYGTGIIIPLRDVESEIGKTIGEICQIKINIDEVST